MKRKVWTAEDDEALRYWHAFKYTDGRIARKLGCSRRTILRQRGAMNLTPVDHPARRDRTLVPERHTRRMQALGL